MPSTQLTPKSLVSRAKDIPFTQLDEEYLAIDSQAGYVYSLNETASLVWDLIAEPISVSAICLKLSQEFAVDAETCQEDILELLNGLVEANLVKAQ